MTRPHSPAAERNREPILAVLRHWLPEGASVLEIGAGTGQHARHFARGLDRVAWHPSEHPAALDELRAGLTEDIDGLAEPVALDVEAADWPTGPFDAVYSANTAHIMHWPAVEAMFAGVCAVLRPGGVFVLYGPFRRNRVHHADSNAEFDRSLKQRDSGMGIRDLADLDELGRRHDLEREAELAMPANNHTLIFRKRG